MQKRLLIVVFLLCLLVSCKKEIDVASVTVDKPSVEIEVGDTAQLTARVLPTDATDPTVVWTSDNPAVARVSEDGLITAVGEGEAVITAGAGIFTSTCNVSVSEKTIAVTSVTLDIATLNLLEGETAKLAATVEPANATDRKVEWRSSDESVATVDSHGKVTAIEEGVCAIVATCDGKNSACAVSVSKKIIRVESIRLSRSSLNLIVGDSEILLATVLPDNATDRSYTWASTNPDIADVDDIGRVTAKSVGTATITVTAADGGFIAACEVTSYIPYVPVTGVTLDRSEVTLDKGNTVRINATVYPENASVKTVNWSSDAPEVACFNQYGEVTAVGAGHATITAKIGNCAATCLITVLVPVEGVTIDKNDLTMDIGDNATLYATILPEDATDKTHSWSSTNTNVATVDAAGKVTAKAAGSTIITATTGNGGKTATCRITVRPATVPVASITISKTGLMMENGTSETLTAIVTPDNATDRTVTWTSNNNAVATVSSTGTVTATGIGTATITAIAGGKSVNCIVTVIPIMVSSITLSDASVFVGSTITLVPTVMPEAADIKDVTWSSDDPSVATVSSTGVVTGLKAGVATITALAKDGSGVSGSCDVTVNNVHVTSVKLSADTIYLVEGKTASLTATVEPANATDKSLSWRSSDPGAASVDDMGNVTALKAGISIIIVTANDNGLDDKCTVIITEQENEYEWVDLELPSGLKWATCNVGAQRPEEYGNYFAWGETVQKEQYEWSTYRWCDRTSDNLTKYNCNSDYGVVDNKTVLDLEDDAARVNWSGIWRVPTETDFEELMSNCSWSWETLNGVYGMRATSRINGKSIFFPAAGRRNGVGLFEDGSRGFYWSSTLNADTPINAKRFFFLSTNQYLHSSDRYVGISVRAVKK